MTSSLCFSYALLDCKWKVYWTLRFNVFYFVFFFFISAELTAEEEAILDSPELTEKDLTYAEAEYYVRSDLEVRRTDKHLSFTKTLDSELMEMERKRQKKKRQSQS